MPRTALTIQTPTPDGVAPAFSAANVDGHSLGNSDGATMLYVKNGAAGAVTVTVQTPGTVDGLAIPDRTISVPAGGERLIGRLRPDVYNRPPGGTDEGAIYVDFSAVASVTVAALHG